MGEFEFIEKIKKASLEAADLPEGALGIGDDCAVIPQERDMETLVSTDMLMEGVHFRLEWMDAESLGWKSAAVNISDIAAMGGKPAGIFLAASLPSSLDEKWRMEFMNGFLKLCSEYDVPLLGGDTTSSPDRLCISVTVLGKCPKGHSIKRSGAKPGDLICVSGPLGDSGTGLKLLQESSLTGRAYSSGSDEDYLVHKHFRPIPKVKEGMALAAEGGAHAMMDISDGVASDLRHILKASGVGARVYPERLPMSEQMKRVCAARAWDPVELALCGGEDYQLLYTLSPLERDRLAPEDFVIGEIIPGEGILWDGGNPDKEYMGYRHF